jgi:hypothetical protein
LITAGLQADDRLEPARKERDAYPFVSWRLREAVRCCAWRIA